jgi:hypothetical protein
MALQIDYQFIDQLNGWLKQVQNQKVDFPDHTEQIIQKAVVTASKW